MKANTDKRRGGTRRAVNRASATSATGNGPPVLKLVRRAGRKLVTMSSLQWAFAVSLLLHVVVLSIHFDVATRLKNKLTAPSLEVHLVNARSTNKPVKADVLAQANLDGGGTVEENFKVSSPTPRAAVDSAETRIQREEEKAAQLERETLALMRQLKAKQTVASNKDLNEAKKQESSNANRMSDAKALELQRLEAIIAKDFETRQQRPRKKYLGARSEEYRFAQYEDAWSEKVEQMGNTNYPEVAKQQRLAGSLMLTAGIYADGRLESVEIDRSSGNRILDAAAIKIVGMSAPFAPLGTNIRKDTDILYIVRTWTFTPSGHLETSAAPFSANTQRR